MCGIVGYVGQQNAAPLLLSCLKKLEYRGYDSAGMALMHDNKIIRFRRVGGVDNLASHTSALSGTYHSGIAHTRWATHGMVTEENAHPHVDESKLLMIVHNGVIENYMELKQLMQQKGHEFESQTDTEVLAHWIGCHLPPNQQTSIQTLMQALKSSLPHVKGTYGLCMMHQHMPDVLIGVRCSSPLIVGVGTHENFIVSDINAVNHHVEHMICLEDQQIVVLAPSTVSVYDINGTMIEHALEQVEMTSSDDRDNSYAHHMLREIHQQPDVISRCVQQSHLLAKFTHSRVLLTGCGTALHACMVGEYLMEHLSRTPAEVEIASELRYKDAPLSPKTLVIAVSQSGETADTLAATRECMQHCDVISITNNPNSPIARESHLNMHMHADAEIGVAATKSFTSQCTMLALLALNKGRAGWLSDARADLILEELKSIPQKIRDVLAMNDHIKNIAVKYSNSSSMMFLGRQFNYPVALEGALKMKEISYIHASGHPSAELKHGVMALITPDVPSVVIAPEDSVFEKNLSNIEEIRARGGKVIGIGTQGSDRLQAVCDDVILLPACVECLAPLLTVVPLQLLAYHTAVALGRNVDRPRNLAKSVTVE